MDELEAAASSLVATWHAARIAEVLDDVLWRAASPFVAVGDDAIGVALERRAVRRLIVAGARLGERDGRLERLVRLALGQQARVDFAEGDAGERLLELAGGTVAQLRFPSAPPEGEVQQ
jgi:stalled ribosome rescue protein Dom34